MTVKVFVNPKQGGKLSVSERLRRLLRQNERRNPHRQQQNQQRTNLHTGSISTDFGNWKACATASCPLQPQLHFVIPSEAKRSRGIPRTHRTNRNGIPRLRSE